MMWNISIEKRKQPFSEALVPSGGYEYAGNRPNHKAMCLECDYAGEYTASWKTMQKRFARMFTGNLAGSWRLEFSPGDKVQFLF